MPERLSLAELATLDRAGFVAHLAPVFEHSPWIADAAFEHGPFASRAHLQAALWRVLAEAPAERRLALIAAHPELAADGELTAESAAEQHTAGLDGLEATVRDRLAAANAAYRERYGFPCIVCVRRAGTLERIVGEIERRTASTRERQIEENLEEIGEITRLRLADLISAGWVTTHVIDTTRGRGAAGMAVTVAIDDGGWRTLKVVTTNGEGRTDEPLLTEDEFAPGRYEVRFAVGPYFAAHGAGGPAPYLEEVPIRVHLGDGDAHYHVPLIVSPWGYTTYRGT